LSPILPCIKDTFPTLNCDECLIRFTCLTDSHPYRQWVKEQINKAIAHKNQFDNPEVIEQIPQSENAKRKRKLSKNLGIEVK
jgi:hypothetical protein